MPRCARLLFPVRDYDLAATLHSGQAFRWTPWRGGGEGVIRDRWVGLEPVPGGLAATLFGGEEDRAWLADYLQTGVDLDAVLGTFPPDPPLAEAREGCRGLRLLRQDPWECLASFLLSATKQIPQIRQGIARLSERFGRPVAAANDHGQAQAFPTPEALAAASEPQLRACGIGFRAPRLREVARQVATGSLDLAALSRLPLAAARETLTGLPGVGRKIADCVLLFACGFEAAFPIDVWVLRVLQAGYFPGRRPRLRELQAFAETHFGPHAGYAQQYLFHHARRQAGRAGLPATP